MAWQANILKFLHVCGLYSVGILFQWLCKLCVHEPNTWHTKSIGILSNPVTAEKVCNSLPLFYTRNNIEGHYWEKYSSEAVLKLHITVDDKSEQLKKAVDYQKVKCK